MNVHRRANRTSLCRVAGQILTGWPTARALVAITPGRRDTDTRRDGMAARYAVCIPGPELCNLQLAECEFFNRRTDAGEPFGTAAAQSCRCPRDHASLAGRTLAADRGPDCGNITRCTCRARPIELPAHDESLTLRAEPERAL